MLDESNKEVHHFDRRIGSDFASLHFLGSRRLLAFKKKRKMRQASCQIEHGYNSYKRSYRYIEPTLIEPSLTASHVHGCLHLQHLRVPARYSVHKNESSNVYGIHPLSDSMGFRWDVLYIRVVSVNLITNKMQIRSVISRPSICHVSR